jgi:hypothetical protein
MIEKPDPFDAKADPEKVEEANQDNEWLRTLETGKLEPPRPVFKKPVPSHLISNRQQRAIRRLM